MCVALLLPYHDTMALHDRIQKMRDEALEANESPVCSSLQGVSKDRIAAALSRIDRNTIDIADVVFALLDDQHASWFGKAVPGATFSHGATTAHIACHVGILQRGKGKLDREGRDYWLKPLWEIGAIEKVHFDALTNSFLPGHLIAKSSNSAYRLAPSFVAILKAPYAQWARLLTAWIDADAIRSRLEVQGRLAATARAAVDNKHSDLIHASISHYAPTFLPGYEVLYIDDGDGDRITDADRLRMISAGVQIGLADAMPDVLLWSPSQDALWVVEAVTSDGEVDYHKFQQLTALAQRSGKHGIGFTTAYATWRSAALRQARLKNIHTNTFIWIREDPTKHLFVSASPANALLSAEVLGQ